VGRCGGRAPARPARVNDRADRLQRHLPHHPWLWRRTWDHDRAECETWLRGRLWNYGIPTPPACSDPPPVLPGSWATRLRGARGQPTFAGPEGGTIRSVSSIGSGVGTSERDDVRPRGAAVLHVKAQSPLVPDWVSRRRTSSSLADAQPAIVTRDCDTVSRKSSWIGTQTVP